MFKCKDCGSEYKEKPDYCDCGNDTFDEIKDEIVEVNNKIDDNNTTEKTKTQTYETSNIESKLKKTEKPINTDKISFVIFFICLILSFVVLFFPVNTSVKTDNKTSNEVENTASIPYINSIWDNSVPVIQKSELPKTRPAQATEETVVKKNPKINENTDKKVLNTTPAKPETPKITKVKLTKNTTVKPKQTESSVPKKQNEQITKQTQKTTTTIQPTSNINNTQNEISLNSYKIGLRNKIGSHIDFASVVGDGACAVTFKIDVSGKLVNRNFVQQSENTSLNDAVYNAMLAVPNYKTPPSTYKNNTLKLSVKFINGNFEVSLD